jgi:Ras-related protein Rab-8A
MPYKQIIRLGLAGDSSVGKTSFIDQQLQKLVPHGHIFTLGIDFRVHLEQNTKFQIWDLSGHERFQLITDLYFKNIDAVIYMFAFDNYDSFRNLTQWRTRVHRACQTNHIIEILVGNKTDTKPHEITSHEIALLRNKPEWSQIPYFEVNSKDNIRVKEVFNELIRLKSIQCPTKLVKIGSETPLISNVDQETNCCCFT